MKALRTRPVDKGDHIWVTRFLEEQWFSTTIVSRGIIHYADGLPGFIAVQEDELLGLVTYRIDADECEIVTINSVVRGVGIGSVLLDVVKETATSADCRRLWLVTTNDNVAALRFYQKRGFLLVALHCNALEQSRSLKPQIPLVGIDGIPLRDEIELELPLGNTPSSDSAAAR